MENKTLYRKYRPAHFSEVLGQQHVTNTLQGQIENKKFSHAYLFAGGRGTGKTSIARIFAKEIGTQEHDLYEIDAASNRGIDDIRELRQSLQVLPFSSDYKVYIIDEAHMLTKFAFDALLKSLEEPPEHVVFILATTELDKIPQTVVSRCQLFEFKKPNQHILSELVLSLTSREGKSMEPEAASLVALLGDGAFRDTIGMLQKVLSASKEGEMITSKEISAITGAPENEMVNNFIQAIAEADIQKAFLALSKVNTENKDVKLFLRLVLKKLRTVLLLRYAPEMKVSLSENFTEEEFSFLEGLANTKSVKINSKTLSEMLRALEEMRDSYIPELPIELALLRLFGQSEEDV
jgi:DNA polymerase-3 subunit gamma/tau